MPKYLFEASYTSDGARGLLQDGGTARREAVGSMVEGLGGSLEGFYYAFGGTDVFAIVDLPDAESAAAAALSIGATGTVDIQTVALLTPEQIDAAAKKSVGYRPPGG